MALFKNVSSGNDKFPFVNCEMITSLEYTEYILGCTTNTYANPNMYHKNYMCQPEYISQKLCGKVRMLVFDNCEFISMNKGAT